MYSRAGKPGRVGARSRTRAVDKEGKGNGGGNTTVRAGTGRKRF